jgi:hypothetical protein
MLPRNANEQISLPPVQETEPRALTRTPAAAATTAATPTANNTATAANAAAATPPTFFIDRSFHC